MANKFPHNQFLFDGTYADNREVPVTEKDPKTGYQKSARYDPRTGLPENQQFKRIRFQGFKEVTQGANIRGLVLLYTSKKPDWSAIEYDRPEQQIKPEDYPLGAIVGAAEAFHGDSYQGEIYFRNIRRFSQPIPFKPTRGAIRWTKAPFELAEKQLRKAGLLRLARKSILVS